MKFEIVFSEIKAFLRILTTSNQELEFFFKSGSVTLFTLSLCKSMPSFIKIVRAVFEEKLDKPTNYHFQNKAQLKLRTN